MVGGLLAVVISFKFHQHLRSGYRAFERSKFGWSHYLGQWLIQQQYSRTTMLRWS